MNLAFLARGVVDRGADQPRDLTGDVAQGLDVQVEPAARDALADAHLTVHRLAVAEHALLEGNHRFAARLGKNLIVAAADYFLHPTPEHRPAHGGVRQIAVLGEDRDIRAAQRGLVAL